MENQLMYNLAVFIIEFFSLSLEKQLRIMMHVHRQGSWRKNHGHIICTCHFVNAQGYLIFTEGRHSRQNDRFYLTPVLTLNQVFIKISLSILKAFQNPVVENEFSHLGVSSSKTMVSLVTQLISQLSKGHGIFRVIPSSTLLTFHVILLDYKKSMSKAYSFTSYPFTFHKISVAFCQQGSQDEKYQLVYICTDTITKIISRP